MIFHVIFVIIIHFSIAKATSRQSRILLPPHVLIISSCETAGVSLFRTSLDFSEAATNILLTEATPHNTTKARETFTSIPFFPASLDLEIKIKLWNKVPKDIQDCPISTSSRGNISQSLMFLASSFVCVCWLFYSRWFHLPRSSLAKQHDLVLAADVEASKGLTGTRTETHRRNPVQWVWKSSSSKLPLNGAFALEAKKKTRETSLRKRSSETEITQQTRSYSKLYVWLSSNKNESSIHPKWTKHLFGSYLFFAFWLQLLFFGFSQRKENGAFQNQAAVLGVVLTTAWCGAHTLVVSLKRGEGGRGGGGKKYVCVCFFMFFCFLRWQVFVI